jgi:hypothetical protein
MLKHVALALFLGGQFVVAQYTIEEHEIGRVNKARCKDAQGFTCAVLFEFDPPVPIGLWGNHSIGLNWYYCPASHHSALK